MADPTPTRTRRSPPPFRRLIVRTVDLLTPHMVRIVAGGDELDGFTIAEPAASVRVLIPADDGSLEIPAWTGNQWERPDGSRPPVRTLTPRALDIVGRELTLDVVLHERGAASDWARRAAPGDEIAISGPASGYSIDPMASSFVLAGDEAALPAIGQLLEWLPRSARIESHIEIGDAGAEQQLPTHPQATVRWHVTRPGATPGEAFATVIESLEELPDAIWVAGEAAAVQRVRRHLFESRGLTRSAVSARGYWKYGRSAT
ncbi:MAG: siderophore-interacting protein [Acidimicrobiia bacterium]|nr:siderophore-interacting protein [Acidimicrobiia bacterium]